jgi:phospholipid/cholesterol/gamma-HCH transport system permease protein
MVREMAPLMTAVIMAGRTGAAYAAQLGTMQTREEIDAIETLGISPMEFLVLPRMLALVLVMPMLCIYSDVLGMLGGAPVAMAMDVTWGQYLAGAQDAVTLTHIATGVAKSIAFGVLIGAAGCRAGLRCGRSSEAVGQATTTAVVRAIVWLVVADAAFNIVYQRLGI